MKIESLKDLEKVLALVNEHRIHRLELEGLTVVRGQFQEQDGGYPIPAGPGFSQVNVGAAGQDGGTAEEEDLLFYHVAGDR